MNFSLTLYQNRRYPLSELDHLGRQLRKGGGGSIILNRSDQRFGEALWRHIEYTNQTLKMEASTA